ncbi:signal transduction histidine kinase [Aquimarina sp. EL_43]|uniref:sensor histidine kinase n=1 Tax=unclassified Aquimarina TaxID=2627091 RepID=UPI0018CB4E43|nr:MULTISPECIES: histidine kinase [unclassified Aquimarina]MBG6129516.1 signal transduction histidine kinase [Aquimarina sp. EL_35]MBG6150581.1 signal transduction histidine kinase [Aquimarina sp. EL_32]MBG6168111.1 signal transduction histidine kinase [Aquimarina sp. EL_43]
MVNKIDEDILISVIAGSILLSVLCIFIVVFTMLYFKKRKQNKQEREQLASEFAATLLQSQLEIKEQTLQNIGRELHDNLGHTASLIKIYLNTIKFDDIVSAEKRISDSKELLKQLIKDLKLLSLDLNGDRVIQQGLCVAIANDLDKLNKITTLTTNLKITGKEFVLPSESVIILYRMSQEIMNNIIKHSEATEVIVEFKFLENLLTLVFHDNGVGFSFDEKLNKWGNGLLNLRNRAKIINAAFNVESSEKGTTVIIEITN